MNKDKAIEILRYLQKDIKENWEVEEYADDIKKNVEALEIAINELKTGKVVGSLTIGNEQYNISKI